MATKLDVLSLIEKNYPNLSPSARSIANYLQQHPLAIVSQTSAEIADNTNTSKATVSRFFRQLGYDSQQGAKQETLNEISKQLAKASRVTLIGFRNAYPLALHFRQQLQQVRHSVRLLPQPGQTLGEDLHDILDDEVIVLLGFRRRTRQFKQIVEALQGRTTILITDPTGQVYNQQVSHVLLCHLGNESPFDSYAAPMSLISMLCNRVFGFLGDAASRQTQAISALYEDLDELEP